MSKQLRSPNYPRVSLKKIISRLKTYKSAIDTNVCDQETIARTLGFTGVTGASLPILSALKKFGLLDVLPDGFKFSDTAIKAINTEQQDRRYSELIERIAFTPELFVEIRDRFGKSFPVYEQLRDFLLQKEFVPKRVPEVIEIYRQTYELAAAVSDDYEKLSGTAESIKERASNTPVANDDKAEREWNFDLTEGIQIAVKIAGTPSVAAMNRLVDFWKHNEHFWKTGEES